MSRKAPELPQIPPPPRNPATAALGARPGIPAPPPAAPERPTHPLPDSRERKPPPMSRVPPESACQKLRALIAWLNMPELAAATELGISRTLLRWILAGTELPDWETQQRIYVMSQRWPHGQIMLDSWPKPNKGAAERRTRSKGI